MAHREDDNEIIANSYNSRSDDSGPFPARVGRWPALAAALLRANRGPCPSYRY